jgi:hypothetical protein
VVTATTLVDVTPPTFTSSGRAFAVPSTLGSTSRVRFSWAADAGTGTPLVRYEFGVPGPIALPTPLSTSAAVGLKPGTAYHVQVTAVDEATNGATMSFPATKVRLTQQTSTAVHYSGHWTTVKTTSASGGSLRYATKRGAWASYKFSGSAVAFVTTIAKGRGSAQVYVDGVLAATIPTSGSATHGRQVLFAMSWSSSGTHTIRIRVAANKRVDVDAFLVL